MEPYLLVLNYVATDVLARRNALNADPLFSAQLKWLDRDTVSGQTFVARADANGCLYPLHTEMHARSCGGLPM